MAGPPTTAASNGPAPRPGYRCEVTPTCWHMLKSGQVEHFGRTPVQTCLPNGTSKALISTQYAFGSFSCNASIVFSGVFSTPAAASRALATVRARGFPGAYVARVTHS